MKKEFNKILFGVVFLLTTAVGNSFADGPKPYGSFDTEGPVRSTAVVDSMNAYVGSDSGKVFALDRVRGNVKWRFDAGSPVSSALAVDDGHLYFSTKNGTVFAVDRTAGKATWTFTTRAKTIYEGGWDYFVSSPVVTVDKILIGSGDGYVYGLYKKNGKVAWKYNTGILVRSTPALDPDNKRFYIGTMNGELLALLVENGKRLWKFKAKGNKYFPKGEFLFKPLVHGDAVYAGSRDASFYALDRETGKLLWKAEEKKGYWYTRAAAYGDYIYAASSDGHYIQALDAATGKEKWKFYTEGLVFTTPLVYDGVLYTGSHDGRLYAADAETGKFLWRVKSGGDILGSPLISERILMAGSDDGRFFAIKLPEKKPSELLDAVYYDPAADLKAKHRSGQNPRILSDFFRDNGYLKLDFVSLPVFMKERIADKKPSIIVLASVVYPFKIFAASDGKPSLLRQYLDAGGKLVCAGIPRLVHAVESLKDEKAVYTIKEMAAALDIDRYFLNHAFFFYDTYMSRATRFASGMGMPNWYAGGYGVPAKSVDAVFSMDEHGRATAWRKQYGGPDGTGLMMLWGSRKLPAKLDFIKKLAEYTKGK